MITKPNLPKVPDALSDVALIDGPTCAATGAASLGLWHELVRSGKAPQPAIRQPRFTRWRLADVARFWREFAERGERDPRVTQRAAKASAKARAKRQAVQAEA